MKLSTRLGRLTALALLAALSCCLSSAALLEQAGRPTGPQGSIIPNKFIVALKPGYGDAATAAAALVREVKSALRTAGATGSTRTTAAAASAGSAASVGTASAATDFDDIVLVKVSHAPRSARPTSSASSGVATSSVSAPASGTASPASVVLRASPAAMQRVRASPRVHMVIQDRYVQSQQAAAPAQCTTVTALRAGITAADPKPALARAFTAMGCNVATAKFVYKWKACSAGSIEYTEVAAVDRRSNQQLSSSSSSSRKPCRLVPGPNPPVNKQRFGGCGVAPVLAASLPVRVCGPTSRVATAPGGGAAGGGSASAGGGGAAAGGGAAGGLPKVPLAANEQVPAGVRLIGAVSKAGVSDMAAGKPLVVGVVDSGVDGSHPDINYVGGKAWVVPSTAVPGDVADPNVDMYGHGTHVAGIIGDKNGGAGGVVGVAPGVGIYSLKILDAQGVGALSDAMDAVPWAAGPEGQAAGLRVINLSLAGYADPAAPDYAATRDYVCGGGSSRQLRLRLEGAHAPLPHLPPAAVAYLPAACPSVVAVTSMDPASSTASSFSNYLAEPASAADRARVMAAPGNGINSTISYYREASGYRKLSGTSMASPHITGVAAVCFASGACSAARQRLAAQPSYGFDGDARNTRDGMYYGYLTWDKW